MKSNRYIVSLFLLLAICQGRQALACGPYYYPPKEYYMFRMEIDTLYNYREQMKNCRLWQQETSKSLSLNAIYDVVYRFSPDEMQSVRDGDYKGKNAFARWLMRKNDTAAMDYLLLCKDYERLAKQMSDPWYYPTSKSMPTAEVLIDKGMEYKGSRLKERYALLAVRGFFISREYERCIVYWDSISPTLEQNVIKDMALGYMGGVYAKTNRFEEALKIFKANGDFSSIEYVMKKQGEEVKDLVAFYKDIYLANPRNPMLLNEVSKWVRKWEEWDYLYDGQWEKDEIVKYIDTAAKRDITCMKELATQIAQEGKAGHVAEWAYIAAFLADYLGDSEEASQLLTMAEAAPRSTFMDGSVKVLRMWIDARTMVYDYSDYEERLFSQLKWLNGKIYSDLSDELFRPIYNYERNRIGDSGFSFNIEIDDYEEITVTEKVVVKNCYERYRWKMNTNISFYYWNDMMRRILLGELCPKLLKDGQYIRALQLANMADNYLFLQWSRHKDIRKFPKEEQKYHKKYIRAVMIEYSNDFFNMLDSMQTVRVMDYVAQLSNPATEFDKYLNARGFTNRDYFNDIIGTKGLRNMRYDMAKRFLGRVSPSFQQDLHVKGYLRKDLFFDDNILGSYPYTKYAFACAMDSLKRAIATTTNPDEKAKLLMNYARGIQVSFSTHWAYTQYGLWRGASHNHIDNNDWTTQAARRKVKALYQQALSLPTGRETKAQLQLALCNYGTVAKQYGDTPTGKYIQGACDRYVDYHMEKAEGIKYFPRFSLADMSKKGMNKM